MLFLWPNLLAWKFNKKKLGSPFMLEGNSKALEMCAFVETCGIFSARLRRIELKVLIKFGYWEIFLL